MFLHTYIMILQNPTIIPQNIEKGNLTFFYHNACKHIFCYINNTHYNNEKFQALNKYLIFQYQKERICDII